MKLEVQKAKYAIRFVTGINAKNIYNPIRPSDDKISRLNNANSWFEKLEESILKEGIRNPIVLNARLSPSRSLVRLRCRYGGSRLMIAQKHNMFVDCIVADHDNIFPDGKEIAASEIVSYYKDPPAEIKIRLDSIYMGGCEDSHLREKPMGFSFAMTGPECKIKYAVLDSSIIFNALSPEFLAERQKKSPETYINDLNARNGFYQKLERSVLREGFRNPIIISAGWFPPRMCKFLPEHVTQNPKTSVLCLTNGGSRLWLAQKYKLEIPCVILDYVERFLDAKVLNTDDEILDCYTDRPSRVLFGAKGLAVRDLPQVHMKVHDNEK